MHLRSRRAALLPCLLSVAVTAPSALPAQYLEPGTTALFVVPGRQLGDLFGWRVRPLADVNGDGVADFAVAAPFHNLNVGRVSVHSGQNGTELWFRDETVTSAIHGFDLAACPDLDADGVGDVLASAPFGTGRTGLVHAYSGRTGATIHTFGNPGGDSFGYSVAAGGDYDGDQVSDIAIGDPGDSTTGPRAGRVFVHSTVTRALVAVLDAPAGVVDFGTSLAFVGDTDRDGRDDLAVGSRVASNGSTGTLHLMAWNGSASVERWSVPGVEFGSGIDGNKFDGGGDFDGDGVADVIADESNPRDRARVFSGASGAVLATFAGPSTDSTGSGAKLVPDLNADGRADVLLGARLNSSQAHWNGQVFAFSGRDQRELRRITATGADGVFGRDVELLADRTGDGFPEMLVGAAGASGTVRSMGSVHLIVGDPCLAGWQDYGAGLPGSLGVPPLTAGADPILGSVLPLDLGNSSLGTTSAALAIGLTEAAWPTPWGGTLHLVPVITLPMTLPAGGATLPIAVPAGPFLCGSVLLAQSFVVDVGAPAGIAESSGLRLRVGR